ncbi:hypothetical protein OG2516_14638 [Oceanicola granulosus HTCC2516]|uniref:Glycosyl transferase family 1 domain-containing protein n=1 Tax=Oceanicola granulosus (strain ATCC BAA-861 / DSM 15982 / KCTC 12143 / HTCC2516) TaxID=314256 RepID=Q2CC88_OCEGH|nr:glycosyltransferase [Oceanicola granulosus]EAR50272.1 hypothetical protein OG2516_14638 [Oceanicola granulosus HTCC2516]
MSAPLLVVDPGCPAPYDTAALARGGIGGTEATVLKVLTRLAAERPVTLAQAGRAAPLRNGLLGLAPLAEALDVARSEPVIVVINSWKVALRLRKLNPSARILIWLHVLPGKHNRDIGPRLKAARIEVVCVSASHEEMLRRALLSHQPGLPRLCHVHNPVEDDLRPDATPRDRDQLLFASAPHKGLGQVYERFARMRARIPTLKLWVADPGYMRWEVPEPPEGVEVLGALPREEVLLRMRRSLCLFYPQTHFAETFGLVLAEANATGTPVIAHHGLGANEEVVSSAEQVFDTTDDNALAARLADWRAAPPAVTMRPAFRMSAVLEAWRKTLAPVRAAPLAMAAE